VYALERSAAAAISQTEWLQFCDVRDKDEGAWTEADIALISRVREQHPDVWLAASTMASFAMRQIIKQVPDAAAQAVLWRGLAQQQYELGYLASSPIERLLIEQVLVCWLHVYMAQVDYETAIGTATVARGVYWERRLTAAQSRYLRAIDALARYRRQIRPTPVQINIGGQQVNLVSAPPFSE
jgi:hypothetical protein